jgi:hypothetical protein
LAYLYNKGKDGAILKLFNVKQHSLTSRIQQIQKFLDELCDLSCLKKKKKLEGKL